MLCFPFLPIFLAPHTKRNVFNILTLKCQTKVKAKKKKGFPHNSYINTSRCGPGLL